MGFSNIHNHFVDRPVDYRLWWFAFGFTSERKCRHQAK
jgi:hypothetical protein